MNLSQLLQIPWYSAHRPLRWMTVLVFALCSAGALALGLLAGRPDAWRGAAMLYGIGLFFVWAFFLPLSLLLAIDARRLRVPGVQRPIFASLCLYGALGLGLPLAVLARAGQPLLPATALLALLGTGGMLFALMPRYLAIVIGLTPSLLSGLWRHFDLPGFTDPRTVEVMLLLIPVLLLCCAWRWRQLLRVSNGQASGWNSPMVLQFRNGSWGLWSQVGEQRLLCQRPGWLQPAVDLDDVGPTQPHRALRVALGGWYLPLTLSSHLRQLALLLGIVAVPVLSILLLDYLGPHDRNNTDLLKGSLVGGLGTLGVIAGPMISALSLLWLSKRWQRVNGELPLLALLPGLGGHAHVRWQLLRAALGLPLLMHALVLLLVGVAMLCWHGHVAMLSFLLLAQLGTTTITVAAMLNLFGGRALPIWGAGLLLMIAIALTLLSMLLPVLALGRHPLHGAASTLPPLVLSWLLFGAAMVWLGRRGWRGMQRLPHPFLAQP